MAIAAGSFRQPRAPVALNLTPIDPIVAEWLASKKLPPRRVNLSSPVEGVGGLGLMMLGLLLSTVVPEVWWFVVGGIVCGLALGCRTIRVEFAARFFGTLPAWWLDEITVVRRSEAPPLAASSPVSVRPSENPVRGSQVRFAWPFAAEGGTAAAYDGAGREVWRASVAPQSSTVVWSLDEHPVANGAYFVVLRSGRREARGRLFVLRSGE
jgi:hypothetical protein